MTILDGILLITLSGFVFYGLFFGLIRTIGSLAGVVIGTWIAANFYLPAYLWAQNLFMGHDIIGKVVTFLILFSLANRLVCFLFALLDRLLDIISIIPFVKTINRLAGAVLGLIEGALVAGLILHVVSSNWILGGWLAKAFSQSTVASYILGFLKILTPLFPEILNRLKTLV